MIAGNVWNRVKIVSIRIYLVVNKMAPDALLHGALLNRLALLGMRWTMSTKRRITSVIAYGQLNFELN